MHVEGHRVVPRAHAAQQAQAVRTHGARGADLDDAAAAGQHGEELIPRLARGNARDHELRNARTDRQLDDLRAAAARSVIDDPDFTQRRLACDHALLSQAQKDTVRGGRRHEDDGDDQQGQAGDEQRKSLRPAREDRTDEARDRRTNHKPAEGRDDRARVHDVAYPRDRPQARGHKRARRVHDARRKRSLSLAETGLHALHGVPPIVFSSA